MPQSAARIPAKRQAGPEAEAEGLRQQRVGVGADGVERDIAEVQQTGETDDDVQPPAEHDICQYESAEVDIVAGSG